MKNNHFGIRPIFFSLLALLLFSLNACQESKPTLTELSFGFGPDDSQTIMPLINEFNKQNEGKIRVNWNKMSRVTDEAYANIVSQLEGKKPKYDVFGADVIWTAKLASNGWVENLSSRLGDTFDRKSYVDASINSATYQGQVWGFPWYTDVGLLYYRKDLLAANGYEKPPITWKELKTMVKKIKANTDIDYGYVFQGADYEGGTANACEFIWNAGGDLMIDNLSTAAGGDPNIITADNKGTEMGLAEARSLITEGITPNGVVDYKELQAMDLFRNDQAIFMRGWPGLMGYLTDIPSSLSIDQIGVTLMPVSKVGNTSYSCVGGWNLMISKDIDAAKKDAAWKFIQFLTAPEQQLFRARNGGPMPSYKELYIHPVLLENAPIAELIIQVIGNARSRPASPYYAEFTPVISSTFNDVLKGNTSPEEAATNLQMKLEDVMKNGQVSQIQ